MKEKRSRFPELGFVSGFVPANPDSLTAPWGQLGSAHGKAEDGKALGDD